MQLAAALVEAAQVVKRHSAQLQPRLVVGQIPPRLSEKLCLFQQLVRPHVVVLLQAVHCQRVARCREDLTGLEHLAAVAAIDLLAQKHRHLHVRQRVQVAALTFQRGKRALTVQQLVHRPAFALLSDPTTGLLVEKVGAGGTGAKAKRAGRSRTLRASFPADGRRPAR